MDDRNEWLDLIEQHSPYPRFWEGLTVAIVVEGVFLLLIIWAWLFAWPVLFGWLE